MAEKKRNKSGRPTKYRKEMDHLAYVACSEGGFTCAKLLKLFKINRKTLMEWKRIHNDFRASIQKGTDEFNLATAEQSLLKRVKGFDYTEQTREFNPETKTLEVVRTVTKKVIPDAHSLKFFLRNRDRKRWPDTNKIAVEVDEETLNHFEALNAARKRMQKKDAE